MNINLEENFLNAVELTSNIRAPGEYRYYYCGENNSESDKSFLAISSMWYNNKITSDMEILTSCHNPTNTAQIFLNNQTNLYNILIYKNVIDYRNENMELKLIHQINISANINLESNNNQIQIDKKKVKLFLVGKNYIIMNIIDYNILLIDYTTGKFITIFVRTLEDKETLFNIIDTFDEPYMVNGEQKVRSYVFLSKKNQERKTPTYTYKYFIVQKDVFKLKNILLHSIDFDLGNSEPLGLKIGKIFMPESGGLKFCFIFIFISSSTLFELVTDYDNINLHYMLKKNSRAENNNKEGEEEENNKSKTEADKNSNRDEKNNDNKLNIDNNDLEYNKTKYWTTKRRIDSEKKNFVQCIRVLLNINDKRLCSFVIYFENKNIISHTFNYTDTPEEIKDKIFINNNINFSADQFEKSFRPPSKIYKFKELYLFKTNAFLGYSRNNIIMCDRTKMHIYSLENELPIYTYEFFQEDLSIFISIEGIGCIFLLTKNKLFKIIFNQRYNLFSDEKIFNIEKAPINYYNPNKKLSYPVFEFQPENIWNAYYISLGLDKSEFNNENKDDMGKFKLKRMNSKIINTDKFCSLCGKKCEKCCSDCNIRYYCSEAHFKYDFYTFHFFECQWIQFFNRKDIMNISDNEIKYKILYNELIKVCGRILTYIFIRIYCKKDYQYFLNMILTMIKILDNFGFRLNLSEFCNCNYTLNERIINRYQKIIFYQEALFFYVHLNFLKCTFALKSNLYNLTDCYLKIINNDIIPLLTPKMNKRLISLKCDKLNIDIIYNNQYFEEFNSELFFDIEKLVENNSAPNNLIDLVEEYIIKHLMSLSLLVKFKKKINSLVEVQNSFVNINLMFDDHFNDNEKKIAAYCYFLTTFYLVEIGKVPQTIKLYKRMISFLTKLDDEINILKYLTYYNLGLLQYAVGNFDIGVHNIEIAYKLIVENNFSDKIKLKVIDTLSLAYLNRRNLYKAFLLIKRSIQERKKLNNKGNEIDCTKLNVYLNYINDLYEYTFISKARLLIKKKYNNSDKMKLMKFVLGEEDKEMVISEQNIDQVIKVAKFIWDLPDDVLRQLNIDNPPKALNANNNKEETQHHDKNTSFNQDSSVSITNASLNYKDNNNEKEDMEEDYEEDIEIKTTLYDTLLSRKQKQDFKELKAMYLKRDIILRDSLGDIEKFNINYDPIFAIEFEKIVEKLKSSFLLKEIFYCFQNEKWRDELYNYNQNNIIFGLSKYLKMEKIKNMLAIERTKIMEAVRLRKLKQNQKEEINDMYTGNLLIDDRNKVVINDTERYMEESEEKDIGISNDLSSSSSSSENSKVKEEIADKDSNIDINYRQFKDKFIMALSELEKDKRNEDLYEFLNFDENYLYSLYINVFKNNPDYKFILQNPLLILNYIFIEINKVPEIEIKKSELELPKINISKDEEKKSEEKSEKKDDTKGIEEENKESEEEEKMKFNSSSYSSNKLNQSNLNEVEKENEKESINNSNDNEKKENQENNQDNENNKDELKSKENNKNNVEEIKFEIIRKNSFMEQFEKEENIYDYIRDEINTTHEITLEYIIQKEKITPDSKEKSQEIKSTKRTKSRKSEIKNNIFLPFLQDKKSINHKTLIQEADRYLLSKENSNQLDNEKTFQIIKNNMRQRTQIEISKINSNNESKSKKEEEKNESTNNILKNKYINYIPFINKIKRGSNNKSMRKSTNNNKEKGENEEYFDLKKEMGLNIKNKKKKNNLSVNIYEKGNSKQKNRIKISAEKNYNEQYNSNSFERILNTQKNKTMQDIKSKSKSKSKSKNRGKNTSFRFKTKYEREKELEAGALIYLKNDYKIKKKNMMNENNSVINVKSNRNKNNINIKKRIFKSTDVKRENNNKIEINLENNKYIYLKPNNKRKNRNKKQIKFNSSTTLNSTSIENNSIQGKEPIHDKNNEKNKNKSKKKSDKRYKKNESNIFKEEYKKIIEFNKRKNNLMQIKKNENKNVDLDINNKVCKNINYNIKSPLENKKEIICNEPKNRDRKLYLNNNYYKKNNFIPTTNYTNSESPGFTRLVTFQGKGNNDNIYPKKKYNEQ